MPDRENQIALLALLKLGLWKEEKLDDVLPLSDAQWLAMYQYAQQHTIEGIVFDSFQWLPLKFLPSRDLLLKWTVRIDQIERRNTHMNTCIKAQLEVFSQQGLYPVLLKGQGVADCYDIPNHRICGDVDWYFDQKKDYQKANKVLRQRGLNLSYTAGFSAEYVWNGIVIENHQNMFDIHNPFCFRFLNQLQKQFYNQRLERHVDGNLLLLPAPILMMIQVNVHILKHLLSFGVGIRQLCDSARVYHTYKLNVNGEELKNAYTKLGILPWIHLLHVVLVKFIGLKQESLPFALPEGINADWMMDEIWNSGNFGFFYSRSEQEAKQPNTLRNQAKLRIWSNLKTYFKFAPMETISFPLVQFYSKFAGNKE